MTSPRIPLLLVVLLVTMVVAACAGGPARSPFLLEGRDLYVANGCSGCHGGRGEGGVGPAMAGVVATFPSCADQARWVSLGSERWKAEVGDTYGATAKPITLVMPGSGERLTDEQIRTVVAYERIEFAGLEEVTVREDCNL
jgi:mono/diheme cytochrome c family protein